MLTTRFHPGSPNWIDLGSPDISAAQEFYTRLLGWTFHPAGTAARGYGFFQRDGRTVGALGPLPEEDAEPAWTVYFATLDVDETAKLVESAGGTVRFPPSDVFAAGRMGGFTDPTGAEFAVWQARETAGLEEVTTVGSLCWTELHTADVARAKEFYRRVFDWQEQDVPMGDLRYTVVRPVGGGTNDGHGGIVQLSADQTAAGARSRWLPYFEVSDADATAGLAEQLGGTVLRPPQSVHGVGRLARLADRHGAQFSVITSAAPGE